MLKRHFSEFSTSQLQTPKTSPVLCTLIYVFLFSSGFLPSFLFWRWYVCYTFSPLALIFCIAGCLKGPSVLTPSSAQLCLAVCGSYDVVAPARVGGRREPGVCAPGGERGAERKAWALSLHGSCFTKPGLMGRFCGHTSRAFGWPPGPSQPQGSLWVGSILKIMTGCFVYSFR